MLFYKMQATENDFILTINQKFDSMQVQKLCDNHIGIGADGLINIENQRDITIFNKDGSTALMCGNGLRCVAKLLNNLTSKNEFRVFIEGNPIYLQCKDDFATIKFEKPYFIKKKCDDGFFVDVKNKHFVKIVENIENFIFDENIKKFVRENHCNYEVVEIVNKSFLKMRIFEYGVGETNSCGSGAIAVFFALNEFLMVDDCVKINVPGGILQVYKKEQNYFLKGEVVTIYKGEYLDVL